MRFTITIDVKTVFVQCVVAQLGDSISQLAELRVKPWDIDPRMHRILIVVASGFYSSGCSILLRSEGIKSAT